MSAYQVWPLVVDDNGVCSVPDEILAAIYYRIHDEQKYDALFYDGSCWDMPSWMEFIKSRDRLPIIIYDEAKPEIHCIAWLSKYQDGMPFSHFCVLGKYRKGIGPTVLEYWKSFGFPVILGLTPENNEQAIRVVKLIGFKVIGTVPKSCYIAKTQERIGGVLTCYEY